MKHFFKILFSASLLCSIAAKNPPPVDVISFDLKDSHQLGAATSVSLSFSMTGEIYKNSDGLETIKMESYETVEPNARHIKIEVSAEKGQHLKPGTYNFGDKEDFYGTYPVDIWYSQAKDFSDGYGTEFNSTAKAEVIIKSIKNGRISGIFNAKLESEGAFSDLKITNGIFDLSYTTRK